jgi:hypothetical protein
LHGRILIALYAKKQHGQNYFLQDNLIVSTIVTPVQLKRKKPMKPQTETLLDYLTAIAIGVGMAALLVAWWSA